MQCGIVALSGSGTGCFQAGKVCQHQHPFHICHVDRMLTITNSAVGIWKVCAPTCSLTSTTCAVSDSHVACSFSTGNCCLILPSKLCTTASKSPWKNRVTNCCAIEILSLSIIFIHLIEHFHRFCTHAFHSHTHSI